MKRNNEFLYLLLLLPLIDFFIFYYFNQSASAIIVRSAFIYYLIDILSSWAVIYFFIAFIFSLDSVRYKSLYYLLHTFLITIIVLICVSVLFFWQYTIINGYSPSVDVMYFLLINSSRAPLHLIQTAPYVSLIFFIFTILFCVFLHKALTKLSDFISVLKIFNNYTSTKLIGSVILFLLYPLFSGLPGSVSATYMFKNITNKDQTIDVNLNLKPINTKKFHNQPIALKKNVIVLLVESLRKDLIEGSSSPAPYMQKLTKKSIVFDKSYATASHSNYADLAFWYSQYPLRTWSLQKYPRDAEWKGESVFTTFKMNGYKTAYISSQNELWGDMINWLDISDVDYFFDSEDFKGDTWAKNDHSNGLVRLIRSGIATAGKIEDSKTLNIAKKWIKQNKDQAIFLGLNLQNTHFSYIIPDGGIEPFQPSDMGVNAVYYKWPESKRVEVKNRYFNAAYNLDKAIEDFSAFLKKENLWDNTILVIVGDSGEAFYEHGFGNHSGPMYDEVMRTLTIVKPAKDVSENKIGVFENSISHIDILPTVMDMVGIQAPETFQGISIFSEQHPHRKIYMYTNAMVHQYGLIDWPWKMLKTEYPKKKVELYNLETDINEKENLINKNKNIGKELQLILERWKLSQLTYFKYPINYKYHYPPKYINNKDIVQANFNDK